MPILAVLHRGVQKACPIYRFSTAVLGQVRAGLASRGFVHPTQKHVRWGKVVLT